MATVVCVNGELCGPEAARVSVFDRGFLYGDSVYEVIRTYRGIPFELDRHLERLLASAERIGMGLPASLETIAAEIQETHRVSGNEDSYLRIVCTRGQGEIGLDPALAENPTRLVIAKPIHVPEPEVYDSGVKISIVEVRRNLRAAIDPRAKTGNYLNSVMALAEARRGGFFEAVMRDHRDLITEGASSNIFAVIGGLLFTPPLSVGILEGVTRWVVFQVAESLGMRALALPLTAAALRQADEVFITSSIREIVPVVGVDDATIGNGTVGPVVRQIREAFDAYVESYVHTRLSASP